MPGRTRCRPLTTTCSPGLTPGSHDAKAIDQAGRARRPIFERVAGLRTSTNFRSWSVPTARVADQERRRSLPPPTSLTRAKSPGVNRGRGWRRRRGRGSCRLAGSSWLSTKSSAALVREAGFVGEAEVHGATRAVPAAVPAAALRPAPSREVGLLVAVEVEVDRVERDDRRQQRRGRRPGLHQVALGDLGAADATGDRRAHLRPLEVEPGGLHRRLGGPHRGRALGLGAGAAVELLARDRLHAHQLLGARPLRFAARSAAVRAAPAPPRRGRARPGRGEDRSRRARRPCGPPRPSAKATRLMYPETRGRISTSSTASRRPVNSSHSVTSRSSTGATVTCRWWRGGRLGVAPAPGGERDAQNDHGARDDGECPAPAVLHTNLQNGTIVLQSSNYRHK